MNDLRQVYCENSFCVHWRDYACMLDKINLDMLGSCGSCVPIQLSDDHLEPYRKKQRAYYFYYEQEDEK